MDKNKPIDIQSLLQFPNYQDVQFKKGASKKVWLERVDGVGVLYTNEDNGAVRNLSEGFNVGGGIGYGGGAFDTGASILVFSDASDRLVKKDLSCDKPPIPIAPVIGHTGAPAISPDEKWVLFITEDREAASVSIVDTRGFIGPQQLMMGSDFYMQPVWHPSGEQIAWVEWDHPYMPWDASRVKIGSLGGMRLRLSSESFIAGGHEKPTSQPLFSPDGRWLSSIQRNGNWDDLVLYDLESKTYRTILKGGGFHLKLPEWVQGMSSYAWGFDSRTIYHFRYTGAKTELWKLDINSGKSSKINIKPVTWATQLSVSSIDGQLVFLGSSLSIPEKIWGIEKRDSQFELPKYEKQPLPNIACTHLSFETSGGQTAYGLFFPPQNVKTGNSDKPPLILHVHSGPTSLSGYWFNKNARYFTSRGFALVMLNYRGSAGYNTLIEYPDLFHIGICTYGVSDLLEDAKNTHKFERFYHQFLTGDLETDTQRFIERSPINRIENIVSPVLLFHGRKDKVVNIEQSKLIFQKLQENKIPSRLVIYEEEGHGFRKDQNIVDYYNQIEIFLAEHLT
jgi:dipeptidyl aminopeptidase/acylaminoacyl peptidase